VAYQYTTLPAPAMSSGANSTRARRVFTRSAISEAAGHRNKHNARFGATTCRLLDTRAAANEAIMTKIRHNHGQVALRWGYRLCV
jgi:hypothetical protein